MISTRHPLNGMSEKIRLTSLSMAYILRQRLKFFLIQNKLIREDEEHPEELRYDILGKVGKVLFVVCALKEKNVVRMISARIATSMEKERYEHGEDDYE